MTHSMKYRSARTVAAGLLGLLAAAAATDAMAEKCSGRWGGQVPTTVTFLSGNSLKYCYRSQCWTNEWTGDKATKVKFNVGDSNATVTMKAKAGGYKATWRGGGNAAVAELKCGS